MKTVGFVDTVTGENWHLGSWKKTALAILRLSEKYKDYTRFLPYCNGWNLDYPEPGEGVIEYTARLVDMAIGLQLI